MAVMDVLRMGELTLLRRSQEVEPAEFCELPGLLEDMFDTMAALSGAGIAAPQIGIAKRVVIFGVEFNPRYPDAEPVPRTVLVNPVVEALSDEKEAGWEGCLSVPGMRGLVERYTHIRYSGLDENGDPIDREAEGFHARVVQHECDHLDGILYPMRMDDLSLLAYNDAPGALAEEAAGGVDKIDPLFLDLVERWPTRERWVPA